MNIDFKIEYFFTPNFIYNVIPEKMIQDLYEILDIQNIMKKHKSLETFQKCIKNPNKSFLLDVLY